MALAFRNRTIASLACPVGVRIVELTPFGSYKSENLTEHEHFTHLGSFGGLILLLMMFAFPALAQKAKPAAAPMPMPGEDPSFVPTIEHPYSEPVFVAPEPIKTAEHLTPVPEKPIILAPMKDTPVRAHSFSLPWRLVRVGEKTAEKIDEPFVKARDADCAHSYCAARYKNGAHNTIKTRTVWGKP